MGSYWRDYLTTATRSLQQGAVVQQSVVVQQRAVEYECMATCSITDTFKGGWRRTPLHYDVPISSTGYSEEKALAGLECEGAWGSLPDVHYRPGWDVQMVGVVCTSSGSAMKRVEPRPESPVTQVSDGFETYSGRSDQD
jgi:hypothetical protein